MIDTIGHREESLAHRIEHDATLILRMVDALDMIVSNARIQPDAKMAGTTDCYAVPLDDIESAMEVLAATKQEPA